MYISYCYVEINRQLWSDFRWKTLQGTSNAACNSTCGEGMHKLIIFPCSCTKTVHNPLFFRKVLMKPRWPPIRELLNLENLILILILNLCNLQKAWPITADVKRLLVLVLKYETRCVVWINDDDDDDDDDDNDNTNKSSGLSCTANSN